MGRYVRFWRSFVILQLIVASLHHSSHRTPMISLQIWRASISQGLLLVNNRFHIQTSVSLPPLLTGQFNRDFVKTHQSQNWEQLTQSHRSFSSLHWSSSASISKQSPPTGDIITPLPLLQATISVSIVIFSHLSPLTKTANQPPTNHQPHHPHSLLTIPHVRDLDGLSPSEGSSRGLPRNCQTGPTMFS